MKRLLLLADSRGMSVTELMVSVCITAILASAAIPSYITYVQQGRVVSRIIPRLHQIEMNIAFFYSTKVRLPGENDRQAILENVDTSNLDIKINNGVITMRIEDPDNAARLNILDGDVLVAAPVLMSDKIVDWHLDGELARRLNIDM